MKKTTLTPEQVKKTHAAIASILRAVRRMREAGFYDMAGDTEIGGVPGRFKLSWTETGATPRKTKRERE